VQTFNKSAADCDAKAHGMACIESNDKTGLRPWPIHPVPKGPGFPPFLVICGQSTPTTRRSAVHGTAQIILALDANVLQRTSRAFRAGRYQVAESTNMSRGKKMKERGDAVAALSRLIL
jgi:hypothetical protein